MVTQWENPEVTLITSSSGDVSLGLGYLGFHYDLNSTSSDKNSGDS